MRTLGVALLLALLYAPGVASAQGPVAFDLTLEPRTAAVGDRLTLTITAVHPEGARIEAPQDAAEFAPLEVIEIRRPVTRDAGSARQETTFVYIVAAFTTGRSQADPIEIMAVVDGEDVGETLEVPPVEIVSVLPAGEPELRELRGPLDAPASASGWWAWAALTTVGFVALSVMTMALARVAIARRPYSIAAVAQPADAIARGELDGLSAAGLLDRGHYAAYYGRLAAALRCYLSERYRIPASALTPDELATRLDHAGVDRWPARLAENILRQSDAVRYARYEPARERAEADLALAYEVVELTTEAPQPTDGRREAEGATT